MKYMTITLPLVTVEGDKPSLETNKVPQEQAIFIKNTTNGDVYIAIKSYYGEVELTGIPFKAKRGAKETSQETDKEIIEALKEKIHNLHDELLDAERRVMKAENQLSQTKMFTPLPLRDQMLKNLMEKVGVNQIDDESLARIDRILSWQQDHPENDEPQPKRSTKTSMRINDEDRLSLHLPIHVCNALRHSKIHTVEQLLKLERKDLWRIKGIGRESSCDIYELIIDYWKKRAK